MRQSMTYQESGPALDMAPFLTAPWTRYITQPILIALLITSLFTSILVMIGNVSQPLPWRALILLAFMVALESIYTTFWLNDPDRRLLSSIAYRTAELTVILLFTRLFTWITAGNWPTLARLRDIQQAPVEFFDAYFIIALLLMIFVWQQAAIVARLFDQLAIGEAEASFYALPFAVRKAWAEDRPARAFRAGIMREFFQRWVWGGVALAIFTALGTLDMATLRQGSFSNLVSLGLQPELLAALILYFIVGFWLLSQARLSVLNARWLAEDVVKATEVGQSWRRRSLAVLLGIALLAAFVPIGSTLPIGRILDLVVYAVVYVAGLIFYLVTIFFIFLFALLGRTPAAEQDNLPPFDEVVMQPQPQPPPPPPSETTTLILGMIFWSVMLTLTLLALAFYLRERGYTFNVALLRQLWHNFTDWLAQIGWGLRLRVDNLWPARRPQAEQAAADSSPAIPWWERLWPGRLSPRERVRYTYLALVRQAGKMGVARQQNETPLEFERPLHDAWPETEQEVDEMTRAFLHARYSRRPVNSDEAARIETTWKAVRPRWQRPLPPDREEEE